MTALALPSERQARRAPLAQIAPITGIVFIAFFVIGLTIPILPLHVHQRLGMSAFVVGLVAGSQFTASLVSRLWAGRITDTRGPNFAVQGWAHGALAFATFAVALIATRIVAGHLPDHFGGARVALYCL